MSEINTNTLRTRISLKTDSQTRWNKSGLVLKSGEIGISYVRGGGSGEFNCTNFSFKIGDGEHVWKDLPECNTFKSLCELKQIFTTNENFLAVNQIVNAALASLNVRVDELEARLSNRVTAYVESDTLVLTEDDHLSIT